MLWRIKRVELITNIFGPILISQSLIDNLKLEIFQKTRFIEDGLTRIQHSPDGNIFPTHWTNQDLSLYLSDLEDFLESVNEDSVIKKLNTSFIQSLEEKRQIENNFGISFIRNIILSQGPSRVLVSEDPTQRRISRLLIRKNSYSIQTLFHNCWRIHKITFEEYLKILFSLYEINYKPVIHNLKFLMPYQISC